MIDNPQDPKAEKTAPVKDTKRSGNKIRLRAIVIGVSFAMAICVITPFNNAYRQGTPLGGGHFPLAPFYSLVWMMLAVAVIQATFKRRSLITGKELLVSWALMVLLSGIAWT
ncbi:MAG: hypothetical protein PVF79_15930, partial [Desulfobacterales bacterium]